MGLVNFSLEQADDGVAVLIWDMPGRSMNVITQQVIEELGQALDKIISDTSIKGCVITSGKSAFSGGADLSLLQQGGQATRQSCQRAGRRDG